MSTPDFKNKFLARCVVRIDSEAVVKEMLDETNIDWVDVKWTIRKMNYQHFLDSLYWKAISQYKRKKLLNRCQVCNSGAKLHVHHRNYDIHGSELQNLDELTVLCEKCHNLFHKSQKAEAKTKQPYKQKSKSQLRRERKALARAQQRKFKKKNRYWPPVAKTPIHKGGVLDYYKKHSRFSKGFTS